MMIHFFSNLPDNMDSAEVATELLADYRFLQEHSDDPSPKGMYCSDFLLELIANPHFNDIMGFVEIPGWNAHAAAAGKDGESVVALVSVVVGLYLVCLPIIDLFASSNVQSN